MRYAELHDTEWSTRKLSSTHLELRLSRVICVGSSSAAAISPLSYNKAINN